MGNLVNNPTSNDEINLYNYWKVILKRKWILIGVFLAITIGTALVNVLLPKIYRGQYIIKTGTNKELIYFLKSINLNDNNVVRSILPVTNQTVYKITLISDSSLSSLRILIDVKDTSDIPEIAKELFEYLNNIPFYKMYVEQEKELLQKQLDGIIIAIVNSEEVIKTYNKLLNTEKLVPIVFNPIEIYNGILDLNKRRIILEQSLKNHVGVDIIVSYIYSIPVEPKIKKNIALSAIIGIFLGVFLIFFVEFKNGS